LQEPDTLDACFQEPETLNACSAPCLQEEEEETLESLVDKKGKKSKKEAGQDVSSDKTMVSPEQWCKDHEIRVTGAGAVNPPPIQRFEDAGCDPSPAGVENSHLVRDQTKW